MYERSIILIYVLALSIEPAYVFAGSIESSVGQTRSTFVVDSKKERKEKKSKIKEDIAQRLQDLITGAQQEMEQALEKVQNCAVLKQQIGPLLKFQRICLDALKDLLCDGSLFDKESKVLQSMRIRLDAISCSRLESSKNLADLKNIVG